jgi:hypothetical protein
MDKKKPFPDDLGGIRNKVSELVGEITGIKEELKGLSKPSIWTWGYWEEHKAKLTVILFALAVLWYVYGLVLDSHVGVAFHPLQQQAQKLDGDIQHLTGIVSTLQTQVTALQTQVSALRYSAIPPKELKAHVEELKKLKNTLAQTPPTSPGYWPAAFQVIRLFSQSTFADIDRLTAARESSYSNVTSRPPGLMGVATNQRVFLKNHVEGLIFKDSIIRFDPSVELVNDVFINCVFLLPVQDNPSKPLQQIGKILLASDLSKVTLNAS